MYVYHHTSSPSLSLSLSLHLVPSLCSLIIGSYLGCGSCKRILAESEAVHEMQAHMSEPDYDVGSLNLRQRTPLNNLAETQKSGAADASTTPGWAHQLGMIRILY